MLIKNEDWGQQRKAKRRKGRKKTERKKKGRHKEERGEGREKRGKEERLKEPGFHCPEKIKIIGQFIPGRYFLQPMARGETIFTLNG